MRHKGMDRLLLWGGGLLNVMNCKASVILVDYVSVVNLCCLPFGFRYNI